jgi:hypothetical protein
MKGSEQNVVDVELQFTEKDLILAVRKRGYASVRIPYQTVHSFSYEYGERHRLEEGIFLTPLMLSRSRSHWLAVTHGENQTAIVRLHKDEYTQVMAVIEARTGKSVEIVEGNPGLANPTVGSKNVDQVIPIPLERILAEVKPAMEKYNCHVTGQRHEPASEKIECKRRGNVSGWKPGADPGPAGVGGEKIVVTLSRQGDETRVRIETGKGFVGRLRKKNWSQPVFNEIQRRLGVTHRGLGKLSRHGFNAIGSV